jgi:2-polyprenyl-3-methyl-5-hydroxy-6-metoxy-1,4-benzoquinol methylase
VGTPLEYINSRIKELNPKHAAKLLKNNLRFDDIYKGKANDFFTAYSKYLDKENKTLDFGVDCYLQMLKDMGLERVKFITEGKYSSSSFEEVEKRVYGNPEIMTYHMHGLVLGQFLWFEQYERINFFSNNLSNYCQDAKKYLEIGGGHGLYIYQALHLLPGIKQFDLVDISQSSIDLAKGIVSDKSVNYFLKNIFDFPDDETYDFVTMGEVLEHVEEPQNLLAKISKLIGESGTAFISTPINSPMIDHIYLFNNADEIRTLFYEAGFNIIKEKLVISEHVTSEIADKFKIPVMFAAFVKNRNT